MTFSWLHFSDLHWGSQDTATYWGNIEESLFADIHYLKETYGLVYDAILFSGDMVNRGSEYARFNEWLAKLQQQLAALGAAPLLLAVPGNHDLVRPAQDNDSLQVVRDRWDTAERVRRTHHFQPALPPNAWGLFEMHGNVREWCADWYADYQAETATGPQGPAQGARRVLRGSGWYSYTRYVRSACRFRLGPGDRHNDFGFRLARGQISSRQEGAGDMSASNTEVRNPFPNLPVHR